MVQVFGILAVIFMLLAGYFFIKQIHEGTSTPNPTTWLIGFLVSLVNSLTFYKVIESNAWKGLIMFASLLTLVVICMYCLFRGKFVKPKLFDVIIFIITIFVGVIWKLTTDRWANFLVQLIILTASTPTIRGIWCGYLREWYFAWLMGTCAYVCVIISILSDFHGDWLQLFGPILNGVLVNGGIMVLVIKKSKKLNKKIKN